MNCIPNDQGGITYAAPQRVGQPEHRHASLSDLRMVVDALVELGQAVRAKWPPGTEMPHELAARIQFNDYIIARVRGGALRTFAEVVEA